MNVSSGWIALNRSEKLMDLLRYPKAWSLLSLIAIRARWRNGSGLDGLTIGQALVGDFNKCGLTRKEYRCALKQLTRWNLIAIRTTSLGTIVTLVDSSIFSLTIANIPKKGHRKGHQAKGASIEKNQAKDEESNKPDECKGQQKGLPGTIEGPPKGHHGATNEEKNMKQGNSEYNPNEIHKPLLVIRQYADIYNPNNDAIDVALSVTKDTDARRARGSFTKQYLRVGDKAFRNAVAELWGEIKTDGIDVPGAVLTNKLKALPPKQSPTGSRISPPPSLRSGVPGTNEERTKKEGNEETKKEKEAA